MSQQGADKIKKREKENTIEFPTKQRALIFQGGGALGAYEAGVYRVLYDWISRHIQNKDENVFDVIAGTSIGAINAAILVSHVVESRKTNPNITQKDSWKGSAEKLVNFWNYLSQPTPDMLQIILT